MQIPESPEQTWLTTPQVAQLMGVSRRRIGQVLSRYDIRTVAGQNGKPVHQIRLESLPETVQIAWKTSAFISPTPAIQSLLDGETEEIARAYQRTDRRGKAHFDKWSLILQQSQSASGRKALEQWVETWNRTQPEHLTTSAPSIYRMRDRIAKEGRMALLTNERPHHTSTVTDQWFEWFREDYLKQNKLSAALCRLLVLGRARGAGWEGQDHDFPSVHAFLRRLDKELAPSVIAYAREGQKKWNDRHGVSAIRDYSEIPVGSVWVADTHTWDVFVRVQGQANPATVYITAFLDMRTYLPMGWHIHTSAPSTDNTLRAIQVGIERYGVPDEIYVDNGREYRNRDFSGITRGSSINFDEQATGSLAARLDIRMHFAIVRNAQAKIIERQFRVMKDTFSRLFSAFKGGNVIEKPERLKDVVKAGHEIPTLEEFVAFADDYLTRIFPALPCSGAHHEGLNRAGLWNKYITDRTPLRQVSRETSSMLVSRTSKGRVRDRGFYLSDLSCWYWAEWVPVHKGREITLRYDPYDLTVAWGYDESMSLIGEANLVQAVGAMVQPGDEVGKAAITFERAKRKHETKLIREIIPGASPRQAAEMMDNLAAAVGAPSINVGPSTLKITGHDHDAAQLKREAALGSGDFSRFDPPPTSGGGGSSPLRWHDEDPIAAAS